MTRQLPRFAMYSMLDDTDKTTDNCVEFKINERLQRICMWINQNFLLNHEIEFESGPNLKLHLKCLRDPKCDLFMQFDVNGRSIFYTDNILLAADLIQSLAVFLNLDSLEVNLKFRNCSAITRFCFFLSQKLHFLNKKRN